MVPRRALVLLLPLLAMGCAGRGEQAPPAPLALRFGTALETADPSADALVGRMDEFERMVLREEAAVAFAEGGHRSGPPRLHPPLAGAAEAAGRVLMPAFTALGDYGHGLAQLAAGDAVEPRSGPSGALLARAAEDGVAAVQQASGTVVPAPVRQAGIAAIAALSELPDRFAAAGRGASPDAMVAEATPHVAAIAALLRAVIGAETGQGTRGALRARREGLDALQTRFLGAVAADRRLGVAERYTIYRGVAALRDDDPAQGSFAALVEVVASLEAAQAALAGRGADAEARVAAFEAAVARLGVMAEASRRD
ncbi:hypothetical protein [Roseicella frigidaeris]|uniref:DUF3829 domain-containing protein n=1 Tax=Roseicella frigidaeris TaxID=2230885 RepID=A0A327M151_9PROT|nr:hypothetical protein [Roseicella frigidaeris]RAI56286.1 hypothetical protein DOO78_22010 [Roseicella frigidaeris]